MKITYHIDYDATTDKTKVTTTPHSQTFEVGDEISFKSNTKGTVIRYKKASPFKELLAGEVSDPFGPRTLLGPYKLLDTKEHHFECGIRGKPNPKFKGVVQFLPWKGGGAGTPCHHC